MEEDVIKRVMPHNSEAERAVLGAMFIDKKAIPIAMEILTPQDFYEKPYGLIFEAITELFNEGKEVDSLTVSERLATKGQPPEIYSLEVFRGILETVATWVRVQDHAQIVAEKSTLRTIIRNNDKISNDCYEGKSTLDDILEQAEKNIFDVVQAKNIQDYTPIRQIVLDVIARIEAAAKNGGTVTGIPSGFVDLDYKTSGFQQSDLILLAARPSMGKTALALNIIEYVCMKNHIPAAMFSLEMSKEQLVNRLLAQESRVDSQSIQRGNLELGDWERIAESTDVIGNAELIIDDTPGISIRDLRSKCRKYKMEKNIQIIFIDYLQLMSSGARRTDSRQQEISDISRALKALARELKVPVVALSQLSRAVESRPDHRPMLSDLRESGAIEQDADVVMFLYRDDYYNHDSEEKNVAEVIIAKQRNGPTGTVKLTWMPQYTKFVNASKPYGERD